MSLFKNMSINITSIKTINVFLFIILPNLSSAFILEGSKTSYAQFPPWTISGNSESSLSFEFRTAEQHGLLLYSDIKSCQYLEIKLVSGQIRARMDTGYGEQVSEYFLDVIYN